MQPVTKTIKAKSYIFHEFDHSRELYVLQSGTVRIIRHVGRNEVVLANLLAGSVFGEMALIDGKSRSASAIAETDAVVTIIDSETFHSRVSGVPPWFMSIVRMTCQKIRKANERSLSKPTATLNSSITILLYRQCFGYQTEVGSSAPGSIPVTLASAQQIALLGITAIQFSQTLSTLVDKEFLEVKNDSIFCTNKTKFTHYTSFLELSLRHTFDKPAQLSNTEFSFLKSLVDQKPDLAYNGQSTTEISGEIVMQCHQPIAKTQRLATALKSFKDLGLIQSVKGEKSESPDSTLAGTTVVFVDNCCAKYYLWNTFGTSN